jgi:hypothetical protein
VDALGAREGEQKPNNGPNSPPAERALSFEDMVREMIAQQQEALALMNQMLVIVGLMLERLPVINQVAEEGMEHTLSAGRISR